jgi:hypothetical protein
MTAHEKMIRLIEAWHARRQEIEDAWFEQHEKTGSWEHITLAEMEEKSGDRWKPHGWKPFAFVFTKKNYKEIRCVNTFEHHFDPYDYKNPDRYVFWFGWAESAEEMRERIHLYNQERAESMHEYYKRFYEILPIWILSNGDHTLSYSKKRQ